VGISRNKKYQLKQAPADVEQSLHKEKEKRKGGSLGEAEEICYLTVL